MKARIIQTERQLRKIIDKNINERIPELYDEIERNTAYQCIATVFAVLAKNYGFGKVRLNRLKNEVEDEFALMESGVLGREYSTSDVCKWLKERFDIDFSRTQYTGRNK